MSAIGSGVTIIAGSQLDGMTPLSLNAGDEVIFSHFVGKKAWQILVSDDTGAIRTDMSIFQQLNARPLPDTIRIGPAPTQRQIFIAIRWQENSVEASMIAADSSSISIQNNQ